MVLFYLADKVDLNYVHMYVQIIKHNLPQQIFIGPLPFLSCTKEMQSEDIFPRLRPQVTPMPTTFYER